MKFVINLPVTACPVCVSTVCVRNHTQTHTFTFTQALHTPRRVPHGGGLKGQHTHGELEAHLGGCPGPGTTLLPRRRRTAARGRAYADRTGYAGAGSTRVRPAGEAGDRMRDPRRLRTGRRAGERAETYNHTHRHAHRRARHSRGTVRYAVTGLSTSYSDSKRQTRNAGKIVNECIPAFTGTTSRQLGSPANLHRIVPIGRGLGK